MNILIYNFTITSITLTNLLTLLTISLSFFNFSFPGWLSFGLDLDLQSLLQLIPLNIDISLYLYTIFFVIF